MTEISHILIKSSIKSSAMWIMELMTEEPIFQITIFFNNLLKTYGISIIYFASYLLSFYQFWLAPKDGQWHRNWPQNSGHPGWMDHMPLIGLKRTDDEVHPGHGHRETHLQQDGLWGPLLWGSSWGRGWWDWPWCPDQRITMYALESSISTNEASLNSDGMKNRL